jgi:ABC-type nitrate/sulfonate/bicarbonate transport system substrate-binding protein
MTITPFSKPLDQLWYTRCPVPTASGIAIHHGWINEEFAKDGIAVSSCAPRPTAACASRILTIARPTPSARAAMRRRSGRARKGRTWWWSG